MSKKIVIYLISTLLLFAGCKKNNEIKENLDIQQDNISTSSEEVAELELLSENGEVIKNAQVPKSVMWQCFSEQYMIMILQKSVNF